MTADTDPKVEGLPAELIDRFLRAVDSLEDPDWRAVTWHLVFAIGGAVSHLEPDLGEAPVPGSVGAKIRETHELVSRAEFNDALRERLAELLLSGVREDFIVLSLREDISRQLRFFADSSKGEENRSTARERLLNAAEDSIEIDRYRQELSKVDPTVARMADPEFAEHLRHTANALAPPTTERELSRWQQLDRWNAAAEARISDAVISDWVDRFAQRVIRQGRDH